MQVILQEDYPGLGFVGDLVKVKTGFARNFLIPKKIALPANESNVSMLEHKKRILDVKKSEKKKDALRYKERLEQKPVVILHAAGDGEKLFGSVTTQEIHDALVKNGFELDRKLLKLDAPIKTLGEHVVEIKLHSEVTATLKVVVERNAEIKVEKAPKEKREPKKAEEKKEEVAEKSEAVSN